MSKYCVFCNIIENGSDLRQDTILYEDESFYIVPALGALVAGYVLIISKEHIGSMCYLSVENKAKLKNIMSKLSAMYLAKYGFTPLFFEHGASYDDVNKSACCVDHAHVHVVPHQFQSGEEMGQVLQLEKVDSLDVFFELGHNKPYLFFANNSSEIFVRIFDDDVVPSQIFRQWIAKDLGVLKQWDWRIYKFERNIYLTILHIGKMLLKAKVSAPRQELNNIYYARGMDGLDKLEVEFDYTFVDKKLSANGMRLVNNYSHKHHQYLEINEQNAHIVYQDNLNDMDKADCLLVNLSIKNRLYWGCIIEMGLAHEMGLYIILITGDNDAAKRFFYGRKHVDLFVETFDEALDFLVKQKSDL